MEDDDHDDHLIEFRLGCCCNLRNLVVVPNRDGDDCLKSIDGEAVVVCNQLFHDSWRNTYRFGAVVIAATRRRPSSFVSTVA